MKLDNNTFEMNIRIADAYIHLKNLEFAKKVIEKLKE